MIPGHTGGDWSLESIPHFLHGTVAQMAFGGGCSCCSALFAIHGKKGFNFVPHQTYCGEEQFCLPPVIRNKRREIFCVNQDFSLDMKAKYKSHFMTVNCKENKRCGISQHHASVFIFIFCRRSKTFVVITANYKQAGSFTLA